MDGGPRRRGRRIAWLAGGLLAALVLIAAVVPLILRGRVLSWAVTLSTQALCGRFVVDGGHFSMGLIPDLLLGRPIAVELVGVHLFAPDGSEAAAAERLTARVSIARDPWRVVIDDAVASHGRWRLAVGGAPGTGFLDAFRPVPKDGSRAACVPPPVPGQPPPRRLAGTRPPRSPRPDAPGPLLAVRDVRLDEIDVDLDFPAWGLFLPRVQTTGSLEVGATNGSPVLFEAREARSPGGVLRLGIKGTAGATRAKFDQVLIPRVALTRERPTDIVLDVRTARTGRSSLHGTAGFNSVFPEPGRRERPSPRLDLDARWDDAADAFARLEGGWLPRGGTLESVGLGGTLIARLSGPFRELSGSVSVDGPRAHLGATIENGRRAFLDVRSEGLALGPLLGADLRPALGGTVVGHLRARALIGPLAADLELAILDARIALSRAARDQGPRSVVLHVGPTAPVGRALAVSRRDAFEISIAQASFGRGALRIEDLRARWADASARGGITLTGATSGAGAPSGPARIDASLALDVRSFARLVPADTVAIRLAATARVTGTVEHLAARVDFGRATQLTFLGERFRPPATIKATFDDSRHIALERATFPHDGGGAVVAAGRMDLQGDVAGEVRVVDYPLGQVPQLHGLRLPAALGYGREVPLDEALGGHLDATMMVRGTLADPSFTGTATIRGATLVGRSLGDGHVTARARPNTISFAGTFGSAMSFESTITRRGSAILSEGTANIQKLAFGPWLPPPFDQLDLVASGRVQMALSTIAPPIVRGTLTAEGSGARLMLDGELIGKATMGRVRGRVQLALLRPAWARWLSSAEGAIEMDLTGHSDLSHLMQGTFNGSFRATQALSLRPLAVDLTIGVAEGGHLDLEGQRVSTPGLVLTADGVRLRVQGEATLDAESPARSLVALQARGDLDAAVLARHLRVPALASASGTIAFDARASGRVAAPTASGQARLQGLTLVPTSRAWPTVRLDGVLEADDHALRTRGLVVHAGPTGTLTLGAATTPASVEIQSWSPLAVGRLDVPVTGRGLHVGDARSSLEIGRLDVALRATGSARGTVTVAGDVGIADARFDTGRGAPSKPGRPRAWYEALPPHLALDLTLHGPDDAVSVAVPGPDVRVGFSCRVQATSRGAAIDGQLRGGTVYSRAALALYDWFTPRDVRRCRILKE